MMRQENENGLREWLKERSVRVVERGREDREREKGR